MEEDLNFFPIEANLIKKNIEDDLIFFFWKWKANSNTCRQPDQNNNQK